MKRILFTSALLLVLCGCRVAQTKVIEENGKAIQVQLKGSVRAVTIETVMIDNVEYIVLYDEANQRFAICPKVNGKHTK